MDVEHGEQCAECRSPLAHDQRYCLRCGARARARDQRLLEVLTRVRAAGAYAARPPEPAAAPPQRRQPALRLPPARVSALLCVVFLGFGVFLGGAGAPRVAATLAASRHLKLVLPTSASAGTAAAAAATPDSLAPAAGSEQPETSPEPAPAPAAATSAAPAKSKPAPKSARTAPAGAPSKPSAPASSSKLPAVKHVFVLMLSDEAYASVFGPASPAPYLSQTLEHKGTLLVDYDAVTHEELANELALLSGQGPTAETAANCPTYGDVKATATAADEQLLGNGCVYPAATPTLMGQLQAKHLSARSYVEGIDEAGDADGACAHPALGQPDPTAAQTASSGPYATFRNPFVYFHSIIDSPSCATADVGIDKLSSDLASSARAPSLAYVVPDRCHDGNPTPCTPGAAAGLIPANSFLAKVVPEILGSKAYKDGGLLVITVDEAPSSGEFADSSSCCGQPSFPNVPATLPGGTPRGGGTVGALLLSPFIKHASTSQEPYNHFSLLRTIEDLFGLTHLGYAALPSVKSFAPSVFTPPETG